MMKNKKQKNRGITLLFAVLVSVLVLGVGASIVNLALKQIVLSVSARDSQFAFYASNTGIDCALYWENHKGTDGKIVFATSTESDITGDLNSVTCAKNVITNGWETSDQSSTHAVTKFRLTFDELPYCANIIINKSRSGSTNRVKISSYGYNTCEPDNSRRVERGLEIDLETS